MLEHDVSFHHAAREATSSPPIESLVASCLNAVRGGTGAALPAAGIEGGELEEPARLH